MNGSSSLAAPLTRPKGALTCTLFGDHPGWQVDDAGTARRLLRGTCRGAVWRVSHTHGNPLSILRLSGEGEPPAQDVFDPRTLTVTNELASALAERGPVVRVRNTDLWDALATGVIRQVIRAGQAKKLYRGLCAEHGDRVDTASGPLFLFPTPDVVLGLSDDEFARLGLSFKRTALRTAAAAVEDHGEAWGGLGGEQLYAALLTIPRVGPWTAAAVVADVTNDFARYPFGDLAVRTWARRLASGVRWPDDEPAFAAYWQRLAAGNLSAMTALTLAHGVTS